MPSQVTPLLTADRIQARIAELAGEIRRDAPDAELHFIGVLKGSVFFLSDLVRTLPGRSTLDFMAVSSYAGRHHLVGRGAHAEGRRHGLAGRDVIVVEDIVDTGLTLTYLQDILRARGPRSCARRAC